MAEPPVSAGELAEPVAYLYSTEWGDKQLRFDPQPRNPQWKSQPLVPASALTAANADRDELKERLATAYRVKAECNDDANRERHLRKEVEADRDRLARELEEARKALTSGTVFEDGKPSYYNGDIMALFEILTPTGGGDRG